MLFHVMWEFVDTSEEGQKRSLEPLLAMAAARRTPTSAAASSASPTGPGGVALVEVDSAADAVADDRPVDAVAAVHVTPIVPIEESSQIARRGGGLARLAGRKGSAAQVGLAQALVLEEVGRLALQDEAARREHVAAVGDRERDVRVLLDDEDRDAGLVHLLDDLEVPLDEHGARPIDGSSISISFGRDISARAIATICCSPPESVPASCARRS